MKRYDMFIEDDTVFEEEDPHGEYCRFNEIAPYVAKLAAVKVAARAVMRDYPANSNEITEFRMLFEALAACDKEGTP